MRARVFTEIFISLISLSISSMKCMTKSTNLCFNNFSPCVFVIRKLKSYPSTAFLRSTENCSARCIKNLENFLHNIASISSACLMRTLNRTEFIDGSIMHFSSAFLLITIGFNTNSLLDLTSTSGLLCLSTVCDGKSRKHKAAVSDALIQFKYGRKVVDMLASKYQIPPLSVCLWWRNVHVLASGYTPEV